MTHTKRTTVNKKKICDLNVITLAKIFKFITQMKYT